ncbi:MAG TPA: type ISP restriction/modification enzyme [Flavobacterium sp.]|jgi:hypothetical protein
MSKPATFMWPMADLSSGNYKQSNYDKAILPFTVLQRVYGVVENSKEAVLNYKQSKLSNDQNLDPILDQIATGLGLTFIPEKNTEGKVCFVNSPELRPEFRQAFTLIDILDYIYAIVHSAGYREKYNPFLKMNFLEVPYPTDADVFWKLVAVGTELRQLPSSTL